MSAEENNQLEDSLKGYKEKINPLIKASLIWDRELIFTGRTGEGYVIEYDAHVQWGCKPTDSLLLSIAGCMGIDVVMFLQKMRVELADFRMNITAERNPTPPQYFKKVDCILSIAGKNIDPKKVDRAVSLSQEKYCSVYNSLRKDLVMNVTYNIEEKEPVKKEAPVTD
jgi:putative redox protein